MKINSVEEMMDSVRDIADYCRREKAMMIFQFTNPGESRGISAAAIEDISDLGLMISLLAEHVLKEAKYDTDVSTFLKVAADAFSVSGVFKSIKNIDGVEVDEDELLKQIIEEMKDDD